MLQASHGPEGFTNGLLTRSGTWLVLIHTDWQAMANISVNPAPADCLLTQCNVLVQWRLWPCCSCLTQPDYVNHQGTVRGLQISLTLLAEDDTLSGYVLLKGWLDFFLKKWLDFSVLLFLLVYVLWFLSIILMDQKLNSNTFILIFSSHSKTLLCGLDHSVVWWQSVLLQLILQSLKVTLAMQTGFLESC